MSRTCTVCQSPARLEVDRRIVAGVPFRVISSEFELSKSAIERHAGDHVSAMVSRSRDLEQVLNADVLVSELRTLREVALGILEEARADGQHAIALSAIQRLEKQSELVARLLGELVDRQRIESVNLVFTERWLKLRMRLVEALRRFPEALGEVEKVLRDVRE
jgi:hypothetical protein